MTTEYTLTKTEMPLYLLRPGHFIGGDHESNVQIEVILPSRVWAEMGSPKVVTVTVETGDLTKESA